MPRIRTIKPEFWTSPQVARVSFPARLLFIGTWNFADDYGNLPRDADKLKMQVFPGDAIEVEPLLQSLIDVGLLTEYSVSTPASLQQEKAESATRFLHIPTFKIHQKINRPSQRLYPVKPLSGGPHGEAHEVLSEDSPPERKGERVNLKPKTKGNSKERGTASRTRANDAPDDLSPTAPATITLAMRDANIRGAQPANPRIVALAEAGVTSQTVSDACDEAHRQHPDEVISAAYVCTILERWQRDATAPRVNGHTPPVRASPAASFDERAQDRKRAIDVLTGRGRKQSQPREMGEVVDVQAKEIGHGPGRS
jgi:hypothetical protein